MDKIIGRTERGTLFVRALRSGPPSQCTPARGALPINDQNHFDLSNQRCWAHRRTNADRGGAFLINLVRREFNHASSEALAAFGSSPSRVDGEIVQR